MTDQTLRSLERAAVDDPAAARALNRERIRLQNFAGARDPRLEPRDGDEVEVRGVVRVVESTWPRALEREVVCISWDEGLRPDGTRPAACVPAGALVSRPHQIGEWVEFMAWRPFGPTDGAPSRAPAWHTYRALPIGDIDYPSTGPAPEGVEIDAVEYSLLSGRGRRSRSVFPEDWRRWAKRGRVLRVAP